MMFDVCIYIKTFYIKYKCQNIYISITKHLFELYFGIFLTCKDSNKNVTCAGIPILILMWKVKYMHTIISGSQMTMMNLKRILVTSIFIGLPLEEIQKIWFSLLEVNKRRINLLLKLFAIHVFQGICVCE